MDYKDVISRVEAFDIETAREGLAHSVGKKDELEIAKIYDKYQDLFSLKTIKWARTHLELAKTPEEKRRATYLLDFAIGGYTGNKLKHLIDEESTYESKASIKFDGKDVPYRQVSTLIQNENVRTKRKELVKLVRPIKKTLTRYEKKAMSVDKKLLLKLSGEDYVTYYSKHKNVDFDRLAEMLKGFLIRTEAPFVRFMARRLNTIKVPLLKAENHDYAVIMRTKHYDKHFPKEKLAPVLKKTLLGMGFDIDKQDNVHVDLEERPKKVPRAFCSPIRIPQEIHLVTKPQGGQQDYQTILHESGHTEHFAHTDADLPYELKHMGGHAVSETYAFLFEYLTLNEEWVKEMSGLDNKQTDDFIEELAEQKMFMFRRYAAKLIYELKLHRGDLRRLDDKYEPIKGQDYDNMPECYADILRKACKVKYPKENWMIDVDGGFYSADYLRAWMLEAHLRVILEDKYGKEWFKNKAAGAFLAELWNSGSNGRTLDEIAHHIGVKNVDTSAIEKDFGRLA
jgi:hypothetical protein